MNKLNTLTKLIAFFLTFALLSSCVRFNSKEYKDIQVKLKELDTHCSIYDKVNEEGSTTLWLASLFFKDNQSNLTTKDEKILRDVALIQEKCSKNILLISYSSNQETSPENYYILADKRLQNTFNYLAIKRKTPTTTILKVNCSNKDSVFGTLGKNGKFSQRVDILLLNNSKTEFYYNCFYSAKTKNNG